MHATPALWAATIAGFAVLVALDMFVTRRPHEVSTREAAAWSMVYVGLPLAFGAWIWHRFGANDGLAFLSGYVVEKSLSIDNLFVFMLVLSGFAVPPYLQQRVLLIGVVGALALRSVFIAIGAVLIASFSWTFLLFGLVLLASAVNVWNDAVRGHDDSPDVSNLLVVRALRRIVPVQDTYDGSKMVTRSTSGRRALTPLALATGVILAVDVLFAVDSVPAIYGITDSPYLVFATNAFALLGLRALYFLLGNVLSTLIHLGHGLALILVFIAVKLILHWAHGIWHDLPVISTTQSLAVIACILAVVTATSVRTSRRVAGQQSDTPT